MYRGAYRPVPSLVVTSHVLQTPYAFANASSPWTDSKFYTKGTYSLPDSSLASVGDSLLTSREATGCDPMWACNCGICKWEHGRHTLQHAQLAGCSRCLHAHRAMHRKSCTSIIPYPNLDSPAMSPEPLKSTNQPAQTTPINTQIRNFIFPDFVAPVYQACIRVYNA